MGGDGIGSVLTLKIRMYNTEKPSSETKIQPKLLLQSSIHSTPREEKQEPPAVWTLELHRSFLLGRVINFFLQEFFPL